MPSAGGRPQSKRGARTVQHARAGHVGSGGTSRYRHRDVRLGYLLYLIKRSSTCRERVTEVEEAFISKVRASYVCITYRMRPPSRAGCSPGLYPDIESELRPRCGWAPQHGKSWHMGLIGREDSRVAGAPTTVAYMVLGTTPTKSQHQPNTLRAGLDGRDRSRAKVRFTTIPGTG